MSEDKPRGHEQDGAGEPPIIPADASASPEPEESTAVAPPHEERTVVAPVEERTVLAPQGVSPTPPPPPQQTPGPAVTVGNFAPRSDGRAIQIGDVLNNTYEVTRFIARGGMGEVFEGVNTISEERVAIKVMLPALAADQNVIELFKKEAKTLTKFSHDALVKYRQIAQSKELGVLYMVTEYIDGKNLAEVMSAIEPTEQDLTDLLRRIASGMAVAHDYGAVHRDLSPDNVILEGGSLSRPKVIDFGIAKDLDPGSKTVVGDGFAGKLNYVAPEQLGAFDRKIGPWTDIYSLALVIMAVINGRNVQMGGSLIDAVKKRETVPDLARAPETLRPVLAKMLQPDPKQRYQNMHEVVAALPGGGERQTVVVERGGVSKPMLIGAGLGLVALFGLGIAAFSGGEQTAQAPAVDMAQRARTAIMATIPKVQCSWLGIADLREGMPLTVRMTGVAGAPTEAQGQFVQALTAAGVPTPTVDLDEVAFIQPAGCSALNTFGEVRKSGDPHMSIGQRDFEISRAAGGGEPLSVAAVTFRPPAGQEFTMFGIEPNGAFSPLIADRAQLDALVAQFRDAAPADRLVEQVGPGEYRLNILMDHRGWSGLVLLVGEGPFDPAVTQPAPGARGPDWQQAFRAAASERDWKSEMIWFRSVDRNPGD